MDLLTVVKQCHNDDPWADSELVPLRLSRDGVQIGFLRPRVVEAITKSRFKAFVLAGDAGKTNFYFINEDLKTREERSAELKKVVEDWRDRGVFPDPLRGWRNELYAIYGPDSVPAFDLERSACALFGFATFGVHATAYTPDYRIWVPRRAAKKATWPSYLDNSAAGGITAGDLPYESMVRECGEEAGLDESLVRRVMKQTGVISYFYRTSECGWVQPEVEYTYDIPVDDHVKLHPVDGEAESFELMSVDDVFDLMRQGKFKPNCALVIIDFLIRHGKLTAENCGCDYLELVCLLHNHLRLPSMQITS